MPITLRLTIQVDPKELAKTLVEDTPFRKGVVVVLLEIAQYLLSQDVNSPRTELGQKLLKAVDEVDFGDF